MGNGSSTSASGSSGHKGSSSRRKKGSSSNNKSSSSGNSHTPQSHAEEVAARAQKAVGEGVRELQAGIQSGIKKLEEQDHPAAQLLDSVCGPYLDDTNLTHKYNPASNSFYSEDEEEEDFDNDSRTISEDETTQTAEYQQQRRNQQQRGGGARGGSGRASAAAVSDEKLYSMDSQSYLTADYDEVTVETADDRQTTATQSYGSEDDESQRHRGVVTQIEDAANGNSLRMPLASAFARRCYFTKAGIGKTTQHYEGLTLTGNIVLMLAGGMKLKGCPTICDEDLRRVEQTYPNQFSRLPDELLLSSGWRRISKYCHFSNKPIPDGIPFFRKY
jgi:hypothetical protein